MIIVFRYFPAAAEAASSFASCTYVSYVRGITEKHSQGITRQRIPRIER